jgi:hypothetical protein
LHLGNETIGHYINGYRGFLFLIFNLINIRTPIMKTFSLRTLLCLFVLLPLLAAAQHNGSTQTSHHHHDMKSIPMIRYKFYGGIGGTLYGGEITGRQLGGSNSALKSSKGRPAVTLGVAYKLHDRFSVKAELGYCFIKGQETDLTRDKAGRIYNYQFKADNFDLAVLGQFNILPHTYLMTRKVHIIPYIVLGIGMTTSNPKGWYNGHWESLKKLSDGQIKNKILAMIPLGFGGMYRIDNQWEVGLDATWRYTLGGSLDGDSKNGVDITTLSPEGKEYFSQYYNGSVTNALKDHKKYHDLYTVLQVRVYYTIVPEKYKHMFSERNINFTDKPNKFLRVK